MADPFHIFALIINLQGQPVSIARSYEEFQDKAVCEAAIPEKLVKLQMAFDTSDDPMVRGKIAVAEMKCFTDQEMKPAGYA